MNNINKESYSLFKDISTIESNADIKKLKGVLIDFCNSICESYNFNKNINININVNPYEEKVLSFLIDLGVINKKEEIKVLVKILSKDLGYIIGTIQLFITENKEINDDLKKYMDKYRKKAVEKYLKDFSSPTIVDFFCGAGGMSLGFHQNGFKVLLANDIEKVCTETFFFNHYEIPKQRIVCGDIKGIVDGVENYIEEQTDVIIGGPPCQGFSMANRQRVIDDPRNILYKYYVKGVEKLKPKFFVMENVKGMLGVAEQVKEDFHNLNGVDYDVSYNLFNAKDFGVPQNRERLIYIGIRKDISKKIDMVSSDIISEIKCSLNTVHLYNLQDAIGDLRELQASTTKNSTELDTIEFGKKIDKRNNYKLNKYINLINLNNINNLIFNHKARYNNDRDIEIFGRMLPGDKSDSERIADIMPYKSRMDVFKDKYYKLKPNEHCKTITAHMKFDCNMYIHPYQARGLTPREAARVQSYPDNYVFTGAYTKTYMQIGNSVPPLMSRLIASIIKQYL